MWNPASGWLQIGHKLEKWQLWNDVVVKFFFFFFFFFDVRVFLLSSLVTGLSSISIPLVVLKLGQVLLIRDWPEIWKSETPSSIFWPISGDWEKLGILYLVIMYLIKSYWMLQNVGVTTFSVSKLLWENQ